MKRRQFIQSILALPLANLAGHSHAANLSNIAKRAKVVVVGGGVGGCHVALTLKQLNPHLSVTLIEQNRHYFANYLSNLAVTGNIPISRLSFGYSKLQAAGVEWVQATAHRITDKHVILPAGKMAFDYAVLATGVQYRHADFIDGVTADNLSTMPAAFISQYSTLSLNQRLTDLQNGDTVAIIPPPAPSRCPPAAYSRAGLVAHYLEKYLPDSKVLIFDTKTKFSLQTLFLSGWERFFSDRIEWLASDAGGAIEHINSKQRTLTTEFGEEKVGLINYIPPQYAGQIAVDSELTDKSGWCPVHPRTMQSVFSKNVFIVGDAVAGNVPKAAACAVAQARLAATAITADITQRPLSDAAEFQYKCYSHLTPQNAFWEHGTYTIDGQNIDLSAQQFSPTDANPANAQKSAANYLAFFTSNIQSLFL